MQTPDQLKEMFETYVQEHTFDLAPKELFEPVNYMMSLGGKRLRPTLLLMAYNLYQSDIQPALPIAYAYELFHNFSLVHDDIMDEAVLRRGQPTVHQKYDMNTGILSGDVMLVSTYEFLEQVEPKEKLYDIFSIFNQVARGVCIGQQFDMNFETSNKVSIVEYLKMIENKTAVLIAGALQTGALLGGSSTQEGQHLYEFGRNMGIAFQLQDDILDTFGDAATFGKKIGGDIVQNKKTFLFLKALELANPTQKSALVQWYSRPTNSDEAAEKIANVKQIFNALTIKEIASQLRDNYHAKALAHFETLPIASAKKENLKQLAEAILDRKV